MYSGYGLFDKKQQCAADHFLVFGLKPCFIALCALRSLSQYFVMACDRPPHQCGGGPSGEPEDDGRDGPSGELEEDCKVSRLIKSLKEMSVSLNAKTFAFGDYNAVKKTASTKGNALARNAERIAPLLTVFPSGHAEPMLLKAAIFALIKQRFNEEPRVIINTSKVSDADFTEYVVQRYVIMLYHLRRLKRCDKYAAAMSKCTPENVEILDELCMKLLDNEDAEEQGPEEESQNSSQAGHPMEAGPPVNPGPEVDHPPGPPAGDVPYPVYQRKRRRIAESESYSDKDDDDNVMSAGSPAGRKVCDSDGEETEADIFETQAAASHRYTGENHAEQSAIGSPMKTDNKTTGSPVDTCKKPMYASPVAKMPRLNCKTPEQQIRNLDEMSDEVDERNEKDTKATPTIIAHEKKCDLRAKAEDCAKTPVTGAKGGIKKLVREGTSDDTAEQTNKNKKKTFDGWKLEIFNKKGYIRQLDEFGEPKHIVTVEKAQTDEYQQILENLFQFVVDKSGQVTKEQVRAQRDVELLELRSTIHKKPSCKTSKKYGKPNPGTGPPVPASSLSAGTGPPVPEFLKEQACPASDVEIDKMLSSFL